MSEIFDEEDTELSPMITPSEVLEHIWCPRFTWFMNVQHISQHEERRFKVRKGREVHARREEENAQYWRKKIGVVDKQIAVYLASPKLRLRGIVDEVLWLEDGTMAPLDYKYTVANEWDTVFKTHERQITIYALLVQEVFQQEVNRGYVAYIRGQKRLFKVDILPESVQNIKDVVDEIFSVLETGRLPKRAARSHCVDCCYKNICV